MVRIKVKARNPNMIVTDPTIPGEGVRVYLYLADRDGITLSNFHTTVSKELGISRATLFRALKSLRLRGYIREERDKAGRTLILLDRSVR